jgi:hypothetical protein
MLGKTLFPVPILCLFVPTRKRSTFSKFLRMNGGDDETRTRDLCRDRFHGADRHPWRSKESSGSLIAP